MSDYLEPHLESWFQTTNWDEFIENAYSPIDFDFAELLLPKIYSNEYNDTFKYALNLLYSVCSNRIALGAEVTFYEPHNYLAQTLDSLTDNDLKTLAAFLPEASNPSEAALINDPELRAKIADTLRYREFGDVQKYSEIAIDGYLESAKRLENFTLPNILGGYDDFKHFANERISRALQIAKLEGKSSNSYNKVIAYVADSITALTDPLSLRPETIFKTNDLLFKLELLLDEDFIDSSNFSIYQNIAAQQLNDVNVRIRLSREEINRMTENARLRGIVTPEMRQEYTDKIFRHGTLLFQTGRINMLAARLYMIEGDESQAEQRFRESIDVWERMADEGIANHEIQNEMASIYIRNAILLTLNKDLWPKELKVLEIDLTQKKEDLHHKFLQFQNQAVKDQLPPMFQDLERAHRQEIEITQNKINEARELGAATVRGETLQNALEELLNIPLTPGYSSIFNHISVMDMLMTPTKRDIENKVKSSAPITGEKWNEAISYVAIPKPIDAQSEADAINLFREDFPGMLYFKAYQLSGLPSQTIAGAIEQLQSEHQANLEIPDNILQSPFINPSNQFMVKRALDEGLKGNWFESAHLLSTAFESSIRYILQTEGVIPNNVGVNGIQKNYRLEQIFQNPNAIQKLETIFGEETVLALRMVLSEKMGHNFRNRVQHGLVTGAELSGEDSVPAQYMWWLYLKMANEASNASTKANAINITPQKNWHNANIDPTSQAYGEALVKGKTVHEAFDNLALGFTLPSLSKIEQQVNSDPYLSTLELKQEETRNLLHQHYKPISDAVRASLQIILDESGNPEDLYNAIKYYIEDSKFIKNREYSSNAIDNRTDYYAKALFAGLNGDGLLCIHTLLPQIEESIRNLLQENNKITSFITPEEKQDDYPLNILLKNYKPELINLLGEDIVLDLEGLFIDKHKFNLRNLALHGLLDEAIYYSDESVYLWWLTMRIIKNLK